MTKLELIEMSADEEALALLCHAANNLRRYFHGQVVAMLPDNARRALENEISFLAKNRPTRLGLRSPTLQWNMASNVCLTSSPTITRAQQAIISATV